MKVKIKMRMNLSKSQIHSHFNFLPNKTIKFDIYAGFYKIG
jgi:hypothetical protein